METMRMLTHTKLQYGLERGGKFVRYVLKTLGLNDSYTEKEMRLKIKQDLLEMQFSVESHASLCGREGREVPSLIKLKGKDRKDGGIIMLNKKFPASFLRFALLHEYAHIRDVNLPIYTTDKDAFNSMSFYDRFTMERIEYLADMDAFSLLIQTDKLKKQLLDNGYNIEKIMEFYSGADRSFLLRWIVINNQLPCHWMYIVLEKGLNGNILSRIHYDDCFYNHLSDPVPFPIEAVLSCQDSAASNALQTKKPIGKLSVINNMKMTPYFCYAYYEENVSKEIIHHIFPYLEGDHYDRLLVIGWTQDCYKILNHLKGES
jgi:hypothetical protein